MKLYVQIYSLIASFLFGGLFSLELIFFDKLVSRIRKIWKFLLSFVFVMMNAIVYFVLLLIINNGLLHIYFFMSMIVGYFIFNNLFHYMFTHFRKKS